MIHVVPLGLDIQESTIQQYKSHKCYTTPPLFEVVSGELVHHNGLAVGGFSEVFGHHLLPV